MHYCINWPEPAFSGSQGVIEYKKKKTLGGMNV